MSDAPAADPDQDDAGDPVDRLVALLDVEPVGDDRYRVPNHYFGYGDRVFGGQVAAQALRAATGTITVDHHVHSFHSYFIRPGQPGVPIDFVVERTRDGRSFTTRRVLANQGDVTIFEMSASFHRTEQGRDYQLARAVDVPDPDATDDHMIFIPDEAKPRLPMDIKEAGASDPDENGWYPSTRRSWMRIKRRLPDDTFLHQCVLTYLSDMGAVFGALAPLEGDFRFDRLMGASLDHAMWFHRPMRADEWFLYDMHALSNAGSRGLTRATMHNEAGVLGVSVVQEALLRILD
jgi:acyl-CoA thioesterase-2